MKRKIVSIITACLVAAMLGGCGGTGPLGKSTTPKNIVDSKDKTIGYIVESYGKDVKPAKVVIMEDGKAAIYDVGDYTMGDFAKMTDDEVEKNLQDIIKQKNEKDIEKCNESIDEIQAELDEVENGYSHIENKYTWKEWMNGEKSGLFELMSPDNSGECYEIFDEKYSTLSDTERAICSVLEDEAYSEKDPEFGNDTSLAQDWQGYADRHTSDELQKLFNTGQTRNCGRSDVDAATAKFDVMISDTVDAINTKLDELAEEKKNSLQDDLSTKKDELEKLQKKDSKGETYTAKISLITDSTGNGVAMEAITLLGKDSIEYAIGIIYGGADKDTRISIYDSKYAAYVMTDDGSSGHGDFLIRDNSKNGTKLEMDTLDTKGVYIDAQKFEDFK